MSGLLRRTMIAGGAACAAFPVRAETQPFEVYLLGTGTPEPSIERFGAATLVRAGDQYLLFDAGRGLTIRFSQLFGDLFSPVPGAPTLAALDKVFLTHLHSDHVVGLPDLLLTGWYQRGPRPLRLWGPQGTRALADGLSAAFAYDVHVRRDRGLKLPGSGAEFDVREIGEGVVHDEAGVRVTAFQVDHLTVAPAFGYRIDYGGRSVVLSGDTRPNEALIRRAMGCDLLIHEVVQAPAAFWSSPAMVQLRDHHTTAAELGDVLARVRPGLAIASHILLLGGATEVDIEREVRRTYDGPFRIGRDLDVIRVGAAEAPP